MEYKTLSHDEVQELMDIKDEIAEKLHEAWMLVRGTSEESRAKGYWMAHIECALSNDHGYLGGSMITMQDTIDALDPNYHEEEEY